MSTHTHLKRAVIASVGIFTSTLCVASSEANQQTIQHDAHQHGQVVLNIVQETQQLLIELEAPGADVVGFETLNGDEHQQHLLAQAIKTLNQPAKLFTLSSAANCKLQTSSVSHNFEQHSQETHGEHEKHDEHDAHKKHEEHEEHEEHSEHGSFNAQYLFRCDHIEKLSRVKTQWFNLFPASESIKVQQLTDKGQNIHLLSRENSEIGF